MTVFSLVVSVAVGVIVKIYYEDNHLLVVEKPENVPSQADDSQDLDLLSMVKEYIRVTYNKPGEAYAGLVHRLDRVVGGVMVFAKTSKAAGRLSEQIRTHQLTKEYTAIVEGECFPGKWKETLIKNSRTNTSYVVEADYPGGKVAKLEVLTSEYSKVHHLSRITIALETGRPHQIRVQCEYHGHPLWGDQRYNKHAIVGQQIALHASSLSFYHPITKEKLTFTSECPQVFPYLF